jgi:hypothetical protein
MQTTSKRDERASEPCSKRKKQAMSKDPGAKHGYKNQQARSLGHKQKAADGLERAGRPG